MDANASHIFRNFFLSSWRYLTRHRVFSLINLACLTIGLACVFLVLIWVDYELGFDRFHQDKDRIYRVVSEIRFGDERLSMAVSARALGEAADTRIEDIETVLRIRPYARPIVRYRDKLFTESNVIASDPAFFQLFSFPLLAGDAQTCLLAPSSIVLSEAMARKYFGDLDPLGRVVEINQRHRCRVTGVFRQPEQPSHLNVNAVVPLSLERRSNPDVNPWNRYDMYTYVLLRENADPEQVCQELLLLHRTEDPDLDPEDIDRLNISLQPLIEIHQQSGLQAEMAITGNRQQILIFLFIGMVILVIAIINFVNHTTARARLRYREIAIRKTYGATRHQLILQFLFESVFLSLIALLLAISLMELLVNIFNRFMMEGLSFYLLRDYRFLFLFVVISLLAGILAGIYPALSFSRLKPIKVFRVEPNILRKRISVRRALVILQFAVSIAILTCTLIVAGQIRYVKEKEAGFQSEDVVYLNLNEDLKASLPAFREALLALDGVDMVCASNTLPMFGTAFSSVVDWEGKPENLEVQVHFRYVDQYFLKTLDIPLLKGQHFSADPLFSDSLTFLINESMAALITDREVLGLPMTFADIRHGRIAGVFRDYHFSSMHQPVAPLILMLGREELNYLMLRLHPEKSENTMAEAETLWKQFTPFYPFEYQYLENRYEEFYADEGKTYALLTYFSVLALLISFLGLFGLASFRAEQRRKEIAIRKVYGASPALVSLFYAREVGFWILWAGLLAAPLAWFFMDKWLEKFAYAAAISPLFLALALAIALLVALLASIWQVILSARMNAAQALRVD